MCAVSRRNLPSTLNALRRRCWVYTGCHSRGNLSSARSGTGIQIESFLDPRLRGDDTKKPVAHHRFLCVTFSRLSFLPSLAPRESQLALLRRLHPLRQERVLCISSQLQWLRGQPALPPRPPLWARRRTR